VVGGSGLIGRRLASRLNQGRHEVVPASPSTGVNTLTGEGLADALAGARTVVDVSNAPMFEAGAVLEFFETSTRNLLAAEAAAGVGHHIALSVVGTDRLQDGGYFRAKLVQERLIKAGGIPWTILRATQFFEFLGGIADSGGDGHRVRLPPALIQPVAADEVAAALGELAGAVPANAMIELAGPEQFRLDELVQRWLRATGDSRAVVADPGARYFGVALDDRSLTPGPGARIGPTRFAEWLARG
jgi:uncharacterized protein YbjT (DUF2867 family)